MSNPTELPDLDFDRLERCATKGAHVSRDEFLALIALARRAKPEGEARPSDDKLWDETLRDRDTYHEWADKLAGAIAIHFGVDIGEHSNANCPWHEALEAIESAPPSAAVSKAWDRFERALGKPEGEALQAEPLNGRITGAHACFSEAMPPGSLTSIGHAHVYKALQAAIAHYVAYQPAAQQADSGAKAATPSDPYWIDAIVRDVSELPDRDSPEEWPEAMLVTGDELHEIIVARAPYPEIVPALAAQSQGAQPTGEFRTCCEHPDCTTCAGRGGYYRLAATAEAPADDPYALEDDDEVRFPNDTQVAIVSAKRYYELRGFEERAQQAAAPSASIDTEEFAMLLTEYVRANAVKYNDFRAAHLREKLVAHIDSRIAPSAPGTPEAPADAPEQCARCSDHAMIYVEDRTVPCPDCQVVDDEDDDERAAQLDGGQGEGERHADQA